MLYAETPALHVFALDAASGRLLWSFDPNGGRPPLSRFRHRGVVVTGDRVLFTYRNTLWALDRKTGRPIGTFGTGGAVDLRDGLDRPVAGVTVSASTPGVVFEDMLIIGSTVSETLPGSPGDIRAYDVKTGALRWSFHTIPHPGEPGYETWPRDAWKVNGGANAWAGVTVDQRRGIVFAATGSASFDFYGANRLGDDLFANTLLALDARTGKRLWHFQGVKHDLWDWDFPAAPTLVTVRRDGRDVDAVAQITKTGFVYVFERETGRSALSNRVPRRSGVANRRRARRGVAAVSIEPATLCAADAHRRDAHDANARRTRRRAQAVPRVCHARHVRSAEHQGHHHLSRRGRRRRVGWAGVRSHDRRAVRQLERDAVDAQAGSAQRQVALRVQLCELPWRQPQGLAGCAIAGGGWRSAHTAPIWRS